MSRSYINKTDDTVIVSDEHLDVALDLFEELKKASPSGRVSWTQHKHMMEKEGFSDSDSNENYRQMIKAERKKRGSLPKVESYADMVADSKLKSIKQAIGEIRYSQLGAREDYNRLNRLKREWTRDILLVEAVKEAIGLTTFTTTDYTPVYNEEKPLKKMVAGLSDLHYGYEGDNFLNHYNPQIAEKLLMKYADKLIEVGLNENVDEIYVMNLGDLVEGNLRNQSIFDTQQTLMDQTVAATNIVIDFLVKLSKYFNIKYSAIAGNHDRISPNAKANLHGDHVMVVSNAIVQTYCNAADSNIKFVELEDGYFGFITCYGRNIMAVHGDRTAVFKDSTLAEMSAINNIELDLIIAGHYHKHMVRDVGDDKTMAIFGTIKGIDDYSIQIAKTSGRSQGIVLIDENKDYEVRQIKL